MLSAVMSMMLFAALPHAAAQGAGRSLWLPTEQLICTVYSHVMVVEVETLEAAGPFTRGNPPRPRLRVVKHIKGTSADRFSAVWHPGHHDVDFVGGESKTLIAEWESGEMTAPSPGSRWIIAGDFRDGTFVASDRFRHPHSEAMETRTRFVLEHGPVWFKEWQGLSEEAFAQRAAADIEVERAADLERLCAASSDVVIASKLSVRDGFGSQFLELADVERLLDSRGEGAPMKQRQIAVDARFEARPMLHLRWPALRSKKASCLVFLKVSDEPRSDPLLSWPALDPRNYVFADPTNGMLEATPDRVEKVRQILARRKDRGVTPEARP